MKKLMALLMALVLMFPVMPALAGDDPTYYAVVNNPDPADRLNLRLTPSKASASLGKYFNGVMVRVLQANDDGWAQVRIGDCVGYMMLDYLADPTAVAVASAMPASLISYPYADAHWLLDSPGPQANRVVQLFNGTPAVILGIADEYAHIQVSGITGYVPLSAVGMESAGEYQSESGMPIPDSLEGQLLCASLVIEDRTIELTDIDQLQTLSILLTSTEYWGDRIAGCPMGATLTLTYTDDAIRVIELATDSCCVYRYNGHDFMYARAFKTDGNSVTNDVLFSLFGLSAAR